MTTVPASPLAVTECAMAAVSACLDAAADLAVARGGRRPDVALDPAHVAAAVRSEVLLRDPDGQALDGFAPLSRLWPAADGWVRTHANYPWHRAALVRALGVEADDAAAIAAAIARRPAAEVERIVYDAGGLAVAARTIEQWRDETNEQPRAATDEQPRGETNGRSRAGADEQPRAGADKQPRAGVDEQSRGETDGRSRAGVADVGLPVVIRDIGPGRRLPASGPLPASGLRVLDLTRVIAGPVGTRMLGALGADVLRVDDPNRPELPLHAVDGVVGKASTLLDAGTPRGRETLHRLAAEADVIVTGYRPGAMRRLGLAPDQIAGRYPGTVVATLSAWGTSGAWADRRGFDSLVQIATGIGWACSTDGERPGALPCQLLDHATGYLLAAGVLTALARGAAAHVSVSLTDTARWLLDLGPGRAEEPPDPDAHRVGLGGGWTGISPPGRLDGVPLRWPPTTGYGQSPPAFTPS